MVFRVAITTTADRAEALGAVARRQGMEPVSLPCIEVSIAADVDLTRARRLAGQSDWIMATSSRAIDVVWPEGGMPEVPVAAVGPATAEAVASAGGAVALVGDGGAGALVDLMAPGVEGATVFFPHAAGADPSTIRALEASGARVDAVEVYSTRPIAPGSIPVDAVVFGSPSAVTGWLEGRSLSGLVVAAIGQTTAAALGDAGCRPDVVPAQPDFEALLSRLAELLKQRSPV